MGHTGIQGIIPPGGKEGTLGRPRRRWKNNIDI
jgi:hypothetical protein